MGLITSRLPLDGLRPGRRRSQQEETLYSYSLNKNYFSNYFLMGGERFEVNDPDYLFGDNCDLNFLTCTKPYSLPYKKAQQNLLVHLNSKQKSMNKVSSRVNSLSTPLNILTRRNRQVSQSRKQDAQTQTLNKGLANGTEPSQPLVMLINIRKETLRLVKSSSMHNIGSDQNSLVTNTASLSQATPVGKRVDVASVPTNTSTSEGLTQGAAYASRHSSASGSNQNDVDEVDNMELNHAAYYSRRGYRNSDSSSITSITLSSAQSTVTSKSGGYTSVNDVPPSDCASDENDECYQDALNEPTEDDSDSMRHHARNNSTKENFDIKIRVNNSTDRTDDMPGHPPGLCDMSEMTVNDENNQLHAKTLANEPAAATTSSYPRTKTATQAIAANTKMTNPKRLEQPTAGHKGLQTTNRVYNIEFTFDAEVDCSIRIFYFCTREVTSNCVSYKPQHATYRSKTYTYRRGLNQKFEQQEHTFQPYLFDEDLLIYKPLDMDGNYNSGAVFPIVIQLGALEGPTPRQSQSLVATVEKSQLDDSYSIKALKQLIFVDGVQYILQDIYGIENRPLASANTWSSRAPRFTQNFRASCASLYSTSNFAGSNLNLSDTASIASFVDGNLNDTQDADVSLGGGGTNQYKSLGSENTFECVICMSDERDTMLLPCRHLCLCSSCAQSLRYQASSCPICRCPFKAALNLRVIQRRASQQQRSWSANASNDSTSAVKRHQSGAARFDNNDEQNETSTRTIERRKSITSPATPLLPAASSAPHDLDARTPAAAATVIGSSSAAQAKKSRAAKLLTHQSSSAHDAATTSQAGTVASPVALHSKSSSMTANRVSDDNYSAMSITLEMQTMSGSKAEGKVVRP